MTRSQEVRPSLHAILRDFWFRQERMNRRVAETIDLLRAVLWVRRWQNSFYASAVRLFRDLMLLPKYYGVPTPGAEREFHALKEHLGDIGSANSFSFVDIAASNGVSQSAVWPFLGLFPVVQGLACEVDAEKFATLSAMYSGFGSVGLHKGKVTPENVAHVLRAHDVPQEFNLLNVDIDSYDLELAEAVLAEGWRPSVISIEINEKIPPPIYFNVRFSPSVYWDGSHFYGCSITAAVERLAVFPYVPVQLAGNNLILVKSGAADIGLAMGAVKGLFDHGYRNLVGRETEFWYNRDVDHWLDLDSHNAMEAVATFFSQHPPESFELWVSRR